MSVNIKTASGLQKLSSNVTKNTIAGALGYTPANPDSVNADLRAHTSDADIHVSLAEKDKFLDYKELKNTPNINDDESGNFIIADKNGDPTFQIDSTGVTSIASLNVNGQDVESFMNSSSATSTTHNTDEVRHITAEERAYWNNKTQIEDDSNNVLVVDKDGNAAFEIDSAGSTNVAKLTIGGKDVLETISDAADAVTSELNTHKNAANDGDGLIHIQAGERARWNDTSTMEGHLQLKDEGSDFIISDNTGEVAFQVVADGTTQVANLEINGVNVVNRIGNVESDAAANLRAHDTSKLEAGDSRHIQEGERSFWNDKQHLSGNIKIDDEGNEFVLTDKSGNVAFQVVSTGTTQIADLEINGINTAEEIARVEGAASANLHAHASRTDNPHQVTKAQVGLGNADNTSDADKPISTAQAAKNEALDKRIDDAEAALQTHKTTTVSDGAIHIQENDRTRWDDKSWHSLTDRPNIVNNDESDEFQIIDSDGNVAILVDADGVTNVASLSIDGVDVTTRMDGIESDARTNLSNHTARTDNPHAVTATQVGLGNVNNTSDMDKPVSTHQKAEHDAINLRIDGVAASLSVTDGKVNVLIGEDSDKSVRKIANEELCAQLLTGKADADFQTLEQMATWLEDHPEDAAEMNRKIEENSAAIVSHDESATTSDGPRHIQQGERTKWNDKSWHSLTDKPNIVNNDQSTEFQIVDSEGNVAVHVDASGVTNVAKLSIQGVDVNTTFDGIDAEFTSIKNGTTIVKHAELADYATEAGHSSTTDLATTADKLTVGRTISLVGDVTGSAIFDGNQDVELTVTVEDNSHKHQISITTEDDDVVNLEGTSQENGVSIKATHAESSVVVDSTTKEATYTKVTVNKYGHVISGSNPTTLDGYGITDAALDKDLANHVANKLNPHSVTKAQVGLGNVDNTSDSQKPVSIPQQVALDDLKKQLSESIVSESDSWYIADNSGNIILKVDDSGLETTDIVAANITASTKLTIGTTDVENDLNNHNSRLLQIEKGQVSVPKAINSETADKLTSAKKITLSGDVSGDVLFDGFNDVTLNVTVADNSHNHSISAEAADDTVVILSGEGKTNGVKYTASHKESGVPAGTYHTVTVDKFGHVTNGSNTDFTELKTAVENIENGVTRIPAASNATRADSWTTPRTITLGGDARGSAQIDGSTDVTLDVTVEPNSHDHQISATAEDDDVVILEGTSQTNGVKYKASHAESTVEAGTYKRVTVDKYGHVTSADNPDESWESIEGKPPITTDGNDKEILVKDSADNVALQLDSEGMLNLAGATVGGIDVAVDFIDYAEIAFDTSESVFS